MYLSVTPSGLAPTGYLQVWEQPLRRVPPRGEHRLSWCQQGNHRSMPPAPQDLCGCPAWATLVSLSSGHLCSGWDQGPRVSRVTFSASFLHIAGTGFVSWPHSPPTTVSAEFTASHLPQRRGWAGKNLPHVLYPYCPKLTFAGCEENPVQQRRSQPRWELGLHWYCFWASQPVTDDAHTGGMCSVGFLGMESVPEPQLTEQVIWEVKITKLFSLKALRRPQRRSLAQPGAVRRPA